MTPTLTDFFTPIPSSPPHVHVLTQGTVFLDINFVGLPSAPIHGKEIWADSRSFIPGGIANNALIASALGAATTLYSHIDTDFAGTFCSKVLRANNITVVPDPSPAYSTPITVGLNYPTPAGDNDRAFVSQGGLSAPSIDEIITHYERIQSPSCPTTVSAPEDHEDHTGHIGQRPQVIISDLRALAHHPPSMTTPGGLPVCCAYTIFTDLGWDESEAWEPQILQCLQFCQAFVPNEMEALAYTKTDNLHEAIAQLSPLVPWLVITQDKRGAIGVCRETGQAYDVGPLHVQAINSTGAGDAFLTGLAVGYAWGMHLSQALQFASLVAGLRVSQHGPMPTLWQHIVSYLERPETLPHIEPYPL